MKQPYTGEFFAAHREGAYQSASVIVPLILDRVAVRSVIDIGCGQGTWLAVFVKHGVTDIRGIDGPYIEQNKLEIPTERFQAQDLSQPFQLGRTFDLAVSLEVAEHLPEAAAADFVTSLTRHAPFVLFSAAAPYQGGQNHMNEQWPVYWAKRFANADYLPIDCIRRRIWNNSNVEWWYAQNTFLYVERSHLENDLSLKREYEAAGPDALALVHPRRYIEWVEWGLELCGSGH